MKSAPKRIPGVSAAVRLYRVFHPHQMPNDIERHRNTVRSGSVILAPSNIDGEFEVAAACSDTLLRKFGSSSRRLTEMRHELGYEVRKGLEPPSRLTHPFEGEALAVFRAS